MRSASCFIFSLALHIGALIYPVSFRGPLQEQLFPVTILPPDPSVPTMTARGAGDSPASRVSSKPAAPALRTVKPPRIISSPPPQPQQPISAEPATLTRKHADFADFWASPDTDSAPASGWVSKSDSSGDASDTGADDDQGHRPGDVGTGFGTELGAHAGQGNGPGIGAEETVLTRARYSQTPRPAYPEGARREGREGRVLLRVLIDDQGRAKKVEVNTSSGSELLDRAAAEAIKRWRFHPARYGDKPVESWIRIPIEFRLAGANRY